MVWIYKRNRFRFKVIVSFENNFPIDAEHILVKEIHSFNQEPTKEIHKKAETAIQTNVSKRGLVLKCRRNLCIAIAEELFMTSRTFLYYKSWTSLLVFSVEFEINSMITTNFLLIFENQKMLENFGWLLCNVIVFCSLLDQRFFEQMCK